MTLCDNGENFPGSNILLTWLVLKEENFQFHFRMACKMFLEISSTNYKDSRAHNYVVNYVKYE